MVARKKATKKRIDTPARYREFRDDSSVVSATKRIEEVFGLPKGSVKIMYNRSKGKAQRKARTDSTIGKVRATY